MSRVIRPGSNPHPPFPSHVKEPRRIREAKIVPLDDDARSQTRTRFGVLMLNAFRMLSTSRGNNKMHCVFMQVFRWTWILSARNTEIRLRMDRYRFGVSAYGNIRLENLVLLNARYQCRRKSSGRRNALKCVTALEKWF